MKLFPCYGPAMVCLCLFAAETVSAVQVKLNNGTVLTGDIVDQNENFIVVQVGQAKLSIAKNTVSEIAGNPAAGSEPAPAAVSSPAAGTALFGAAPSKSVEITLNNGSKFTGKIAAMDDRVIEIETAGGSRLVFYKINITDVHDLSGSAPAAAPVVQASAVSAQAAAPASASHAASAEAVPGKTVEITLKSGAKFKGMVTSADDRHIMLEVARGSTLDFYRQVIVDIRDLSVPGVPVAAPAPVVAPPAPQPPPAPAPVITAVKHAPAPMSAAVKPAPSPAAPAPAPVVAPPAPQPTPVIAPPIDKDKNELKLKNSVVLRGTIVSANDRYIVFSTPGVTVNVLRRFITSVDGAANADTMMPARGLTAAPAPDRSAAVAELVKALADPSAEIRKKTVSALGAMGDTIAVLPLAAVLNDSDGAV
ncbi:MAG: hypothetical protein JW699_06400, partial [Chitinispirillaceae bacterium]|nr:hypothetical protein [Chitinispirillaceae bacterium]